MNKDFLICAVAILCYVVLISIVAVFEYLEDKKHYCVRVDDSVYPDVWCFKRWGRRVSFKYVGYKGQVKTYVGYPKSYSFYRKVGAKYE